MKFRLVAPACVLAIVLGHTAQASELRYVPINPAFGGNPFNGSHLMARASAQNDHERPTTTTSNAENLRRTIQNSVLSRTALNIADRIFTPDPGAVGQRIVAYGDDTTRIEYVQDGAGGVTIYITDLATGAVTSVGANTDSTS